jgi:hypothetical protein
MNLAAVIQRRAADRRARKARHNQARPSQEA